MKSFIDHLKDYVDPERHEINARYAASQKHKHDEPTISHDHSPHAQRSIPQPPEPHKDDADHIAHFKELHRQLEETGRHLHNKGYHIDIDYQSHHAARHGKDGQGSTLFYNVALASPKRLTISKRATESYRGNHPPK